MTKEVAKEVKKEETKKHVELPTKTANEMVITVEGSEGRMYRFAMPFFSPLPECYNASINVANEIARLFNEAVEKQKEKEQEKQIDQEEEDTKEKASETPEVTN